jgi:hypothetical protein
LAKAKAKAAVKRKPAKAQTGTAVARVAKVPKKAAVAKVAKPAKPVAAKAPAVAKAAVAKPEKKPPIAASQRKEEQLTLPVAKPAEAPAAQPAPVVRKVVVSTTVRADLPPPDGFTLLVDGHFKNQFEDLKGAKAAASELKGRFPMLKVEIYDAAKKTRLPAS